MLRVQGLASVGTHSRRLSSEIETARRLLAISQVTEDVETNLPI